MPKGQRKPRPREWNTGLETNCLPSQLEPQNALDGDAIEPARRAGVPGPATPARVRRGAIHVGANHIGLDFVALHFLSRGGMVDRVDKVPEFRGAVAPTLQRRRQSHPSGGVGVLAAVLANT